ncbi:hypothetical protein [Streptomyces sp. NPDC058108]|uniref:hypothetical protein n=1 Tax=Streptomyces sp. NPDC058108 TaxID=3346344 RepID=UPI0036E8869C
MPAHPSQVNVSPPEPAPDGPEGSKVVEAAVLDDEHPNVVARFRYLSLPMQPLLTIGVSVDSRAAGSVYDNTTIGASGIREMPIARWDRTAQAAVVQQLGKVMGEEPETSPAEWAAQLVGEKFPELAEPRDGHELRRRKSLLHLAEAAEEYARIAATGERNPAGVLAERRGTTASTVRGWLHRARREGIARDAS